MHIYLWTSVFALPSSVFFRLLHEPSNVRYFLSSGHSGNGGQSVSNLVPRMSAPTKLKRTELKIHRLWLYNYIRLHRYYNLGINYCPTSILNFKTYLAYGPSNWALKTLPHAPPIIAKRESLPTPGACLWNLKCLKAADFPDASSFKRDPVCSVEETLSANLAPISAA